MNWAQQKLKLRARFDALLTALGGRCALCGCETALTVDHVRGRNWEKPARKYSWRQRIARYEAELREGIELRCLCHFCNSTAHPATCTCPKCEVELGMLHQDEFDPAPF